MPPSSHWTPISGVKNKMDTFAIVS